MLRYIVDNSSITKIFSKKKRVQMSALKTSNLPYRIPI